MPRNSSGTYTLPAGNPVVTNTVISSIWANTTLSDLATAMTDSLSRTGEGGMLAPLELDAGTIGAPGLSWTTETTSGLYRAGAGDFRYAIAAADVFGLTANGARLANGSAGTPSLSFLSDTDLGFYRHSANTLGISAGGVEIVLIDTTGMSINGVFSPTRLRAGDGTAALPSYSFSNDVDTGMYLDSVGQIGWSVGGVRRAAMDTNSFFVGDGAVGTPALSFLADPDNGLYRAGANNWAAVAGGVSVMTWVPSGTISTGQLFAQDGSAALPAYTFLNRQDTGAYLSGTSFGVSTEGTLRSIWTSVYQISRVLYLAPDGSAAGPSYSFENDADSGFYRAGSNNIGVAVNGANIARFAGQGSGELQMSNGAFNLPAYTFFNDAGTGIYLVSSNNLGVAIGGVASARWNASATGFNTTTPGPNAFQGLTLIPISVNDNTNGIAWQFSGGTQAGIWVYNSSLIGSRMYIATTDNYTTGAKTAIYISEAQRVHFVDGSAGAPSITLQNDPDTGIYSFGANALGITTGGSARIVISSSFFNFSGSAQAVAPDGSASLPSYSFVNDQNTGFYSLSADHIGITTNGATLGAFAGGSFTGTLTGMTTTVQGTLNWFRYGNMVVIYGQALQGTSNANSMTLTGLPSAIQTGSTSRCMPVSLVNNSVNSIGGATVSGGTVTFGNGTSFDPNGFTTSNTKGMGQGIYVVYFLAGS